MRKPSELSARRHDNLFAQIGSKRQWIDRILEMIKEKHIGTVFDPCAGAGHLPIAIGEEKEAKIILNDVNPVNYYFLKRKCKGGKLRNGNYKDWKSASKVNGYFTKNFTKSRKSLRMYIDGLVKKADSWLKKSYLSDLLRRGFHRGGSTWQTSSDSDLTTESKAKNYLDKIHDKNYGVNTNFKVTKKDIKDLKFPRVDLVIFDPPYKGTANTIPPDASVLLQRDIEFNFPHDELKEVLKELKKKSRHQLFFGGSEEKEVMEELGMEVGEWELSTGGMDWSKGSKNRVEYVHTSLSKFREELSEMEIIELLKLERDLRFSV